MTRRVERGLWLITTILVALAVVGWHGGSATGGDEGRTAREGTGRLSTASTSPESGALTTLAARIVARDPFRLERKPSSVAFGATPPAAVPVDPSRRPRLLLSGVSGPPWQAVLEGIPGREGSVVVRVGDVFGELRVRSIRRDTVVVQGADTTWKLTVRKVW